MNSAGQEVTESIAYLAFIRGGGTVIPQPSWTQPAWYIDPQNVTGLASDRNNGASAGSPVRTFNGGVIERYQTYTPQLLQATRYKWLSSALAADRATFQPILLGNGGALLEGTLQLLGNKTLTTFTAQSRAAGTPNTINVTGQTWAPGTIVRDLTAGATFTIDADLGGGTARITLPVAYPITFRPVPVTLTAGDTLALYAPTDLYVQNIGGQNGGNGSGDGFRVLNVNITSELIAIVGSAVVLESTVKNCVVQNAEPQVASGTIFSDVWFQDYFGGGAFTGSATFWAGALNGAGNNFYNLTQLNIDVMVNLRAHYNGTILVCSAYFGQWPTNTVGEQTLANMIVSPSDAQIPAVWGPTTIALSTGQRLIVRDSPSTTAVNALLCTGGITLDGSTSAFRFDPAGPTYVATTVSPTNLDLYRSISNPVTGTGMTAI